MYHIGFWFFRSVFVLSAVLVLNLGYVRAQTENQVAKFDADGNLVDSDITEIDGNVGLGTTTPTAKLHVAGGNVQLDDSTAMAGNILKGGVPFIHNFGTNNTFLGQNAGNLSTTGIGGNTGVGVNTLRSNTTGDNNTAIGVNALQSNTTGIQNTANGTSALSSNTTGNGNTAIGASALQSNTVGVTNTATGSGTLLSNTTGFSNTATGASALVSNTTGVTNTASGAGALLSNTTGSNNTATGTFALLNNTTGNVNTAIGVNALGSNTTGSFNTAIGRDANVSTGNLTNATAIGANARVAQSNSLVLGNNASVGIGTSAPKAKLHVEGGDVYLPTQGNGIILKATNGPNCFRVTVDNEGVLSTTPIACP